MKRYWKQIVMILALAVVALAGRGLWAHEGMDMGEQPKMPAAFDKIKGLLGTWTGSMDMGGKPMAYSVTYDLTAGGSAIIEKEFAGSPHEMTTVFYVEGDQVVLTHYCMLGNQPHMILKKSTDNSLVFDMEGHKGVKSVKEHHMHGLTLSFVDATHPKAEWTEYEKGKKANVKVFDLTKADTTKKM